MATVVASEMLTQIKELRILSSDVSQKIEEDGFEEQCSPETLEQMGYF